MKLLLFALLGLFLPACTHVRIERVDIWGCDGNATLTVRIDNKLDLSIGDWSMSLSVLPAL